VHNRFSKSLCDNMMKSNKTAGKGRWTISVPLFLFVLIYTMQTSQQVRASSIMDEFALLLSKDQDSDGNDFELSAELLSDGVDRSIKMESSHGRRNTQEGDDIRRRRSDDEGDDGDDRSGAGEVEDRFIRNPQNDNFKSPPIVIPDMDDWWSHPNKGTNYFKSMPTRVSNQLCRGRLNVKHDAEPLTQPAFLKMSATNTVTKTISTPYETAGQSSHAETFSSPSYPTPYK